MRSMLARRRLLRPELSTATVCLLAALSAVRARGDRSLALSLRASRFWPPFPPLLLLAARCGIAAHQHCRVGMLATPTPAALLSLAQARVVVACGRWRCCDNSLNTRVHRFLVLDAAPVRVVRAHLILAAEAERPTASSPFARI